MTPVFSINAASELLERDRRTVTKAMRHVPPDKKEKGQPRWKLPTILAALDELPGSSTAPRRSSRNTSTGDVDPRITEATDNLQLAFDKLQTMEDVEQRRAYARKEVGPLIMHNNHHLRLWMIENGREETFAQLGSEQIWHMSINIVRHFCEWTDDEAYDELVIPNDDWGEDELAEHRENRKQKNKKLLARLKQMEKEHAFD